MSSLRPLAVLVIAAGLVLVACDRGTAAGREPRATTMAARAGETVDIGTLPAHVAGRYRFIEQHQALARRIPCYCGCSSLGHRDLADCFISPKGGYEAHAADCGVCVAEAQDVENMLGQGLSARVIRERIDAAYAEMGAGTNTPKP